MSPTKLNGCRLLVCTLALAAIAPAHAQTFTETVLHNFADAPRGENPWAGVIRDSAGNLYGTALSGGTVDLPRRRLDCRPWCSRLTRRERRRCSTCLPFGGRGEKDRALRYLRITVE
jgi:hypothetical protein